MKKSIRVLLFVVIFQLLFLNLVCFAYPITFYDQDLKKVIRERIKKTYDEVEELRDIKKQEEKLKREKEYEEDLSEEYEQDAKIENFDKFVENSDFDNAELISFSNASKYRTEVLNNNVPNFDKSQYDGVVFEDYSSFDSLGRCGKAEALLGIETMPQVGESRESIGMIKPSGWQTPQSKYDFIDGKFLYNRCHLIGWQLSNENSNEKNLITGTRWLNTKGMLPYENKVANYIRKTKNHVLYRVTPIFENSNLLASKIHIEALSYEDDGEGIKFNVLLDNYQPGVVIDYATGKNWVEN